MSSIQAPTVSPFISSLSPRAASASPTSGTSGTSSNNSQTSVGALGSTFLQLLTQELQNQDPTAPVDSTQMVGQMISLNQLDQLASINQTLTNQFPTAAAASSASPSSRSAAGASANQASITAAVQAAMQALNSSPTATNPSTLVSLPAL